MRKGALFLACFLALVAGAHALESKTRSVSSSKQFIIYCDDHLLRARISSFCEETKSSVLSLLSEGDHWKIPVVIRLERAGAAVSGTPVRLQFLETPDGSKIQLDVQVADDPSAVNLQKQIARVVLLEIAYRDRGGVKAGETYLEAPWWLLEGAVQIIRRRDRGVDTAFFRHLIEGNKLPPVEDFLALREADPGSTAEAVDATCSMCLVQLLIEQPSGRANLARLLKKWSEYSGDSILALGKQFPALADRANLQKWWTVNLARFSAADRYKGLSAEDTDAELQRLLQLDVVVDQVGQKKTFKFSQFPEFAKLPGAKTALNGLRKNLSTLEARANAILRPVLRDYGQLAHDIARSRLKNASDRLEQIEQYRTLVLHRIGEIADYLNWYEATQIGTRSGAFDSYLKAANDLSAQEARRRNPIAQYLDELQQEF